jgi:holo-[acyl-carrier protein] synthase
VRGVVGVGIDLVDVDRLAAAMRRRPGLAARVFTDRERATTATGARASERLAARFAAKEATMKALGVGLGAFALRDVEVLVSDAGAPSLVLSGAARAAAERRGAGALHVSLTHTAASASAVVIAESTG